MMRFTFSSRLQDIFSFLICQSTAAMNLPWILILLCFEVVALLVWSRLETQINQ